MRDLDIHIASGSGMILRDRPGSTRDTHCVVVGIPETVSDQAVMRQIDQLAIWPWPETLAWSNVAGLPQGRVVRTDRSDDAA